MSPSAFNFLKNIALKTCGFWRLSANVGVKQMLAMDLGLKNRQQKCFSTPLAPFRLRRNAAAKIEKYFFSLNLKVPQNIYRTQKVQEEEKNL